MALFFPGPEPDDPSMDGEDTARAASVLDPPPLKPPPGFGNVKAVKTEEDVPLLTEADVSIHELDEDDLEVIDDHDDDEDNGDEDNDTGIRNEAELPEHLRKAIADANSERDD